MLINIIILNVLKYSKEMCGRSCHHGLSSQGYERSFVIEMKDHYHIYKNSYLANKSITSFERNVLMPRVLKSCDIYGYCTEIYS